VKNKGPETLSDFVKQRKRIASGHKHLIATMEYAVGTLKSGSILKYVLKDMSWKPRNIIYMILLIAVEAMARIIGNVDFYLRDKNPYIWDISRTTKQFNIHPEPVKKK